MSTEGAGLQDIPDQVAEAEFYISLWSRAQGKLVDAKDKLLDKVRNGGFGDDCNKTMNALGTSTSELVSRVMYGTVNFVDGLSSSAAWTGLIPGGRLLSFLSPTIGDVMKTFRVEAFGELGGDKIYLNSIVLIGQSTEHNAALILHELLHNVTGKLDTTIQGELGLEKDSVDTHNITDRIMKDCFK